MSHHRMHLQAPICTSWLKLRVFFSRMLADNDMRLQIDIIHTPLGKSCLDRKCNPELKNLIINFR